MLAGRQDQLTGRDGALARYAATLTERPWAAGPDLVRELTAHGLDAAAIEAATGVVAVFNYLTRVADASGIEFDYNSPLPRFEPDRRRRAAARPARHAWPLVGERYRTFPRFPALARAWASWREYVFHCDEPLPRRERAVLALAAAAECCDRWRVEALAEYGPANGKEARLAEFAGKLSREPWRMQRRDLEDLRELGYPEPALLHVIAVVALQNAESRVAMAHRLTHPDG